MPTRGEREKKHSYNLVAGTYVFQWHEYYMRPRCDDGKTAYSGAANNDLALYAFCV